MFRCISGALGVLLSSTLLLTGCSSSNGDKPSGDSDRSAASPADGASTDSPMPSFGAPKKFDGEPVPISLPALDANMAGDFTSRFTLAGDKAYGVTRGSVGAVDLETGETLWETRFPTGPDEDPGQIMFDSRGPGAPVVSEDGSTVYGVLVVDIPGSGTTSDSYALQLVAVDAETGDLSWSADIPAGSEVYQANAESVHVVVEVDGRVIVSRDGDGSGIGEGTVGAVDTATHKVLWSKPGSAYAVTPEAVIVTAENGKANDAAYPQLIGLDPATGEAKWTGGYTPDTAVSGVSTVQTDDSLIVTVQPYSGADPYTGVLDPATGKITKRFTGVVLYDPIRDVDAVYDVSNTAGLRALDPTTLKLIWVLPEGNRVAPESPVFFGGLVYGQVNNNMSVILDGKTGADVTANIPGDFIAVNEHGAIMRVNSQLVFVPATG